MRTARALAAAVVAVPLLLAWLAAPVEGAGPYSFPHRPHLSKEAVAGTSEQDCRVCHDYSGGRREAHFEGCAGCHKGKEGNLELTLRGAYTRPAFQHKEHLFAKDGTARKDIQCATCHAMKAGDNWIEFDLPAPGLGPKSRGGALKTCADCHAKHEAPGGLVRQDETTGDGLACAVCHLGATAIEPVRYRADARPSPSRRFLHADHGGAASDCESCHGSIRTSRTVWDYAPSDATKSKCESCHMDASGRPLAVVSPRTTKIERIDFSRFPHAAHLGEFTRMQCRTCHYPETEAAMRKAFPRRVASPEPVGRDALLDFDACDACHGHDGWAPNKPSWHVEHHGVGGEGGWGCFKCHDGRTDALGKLLIAEADVARPSLGASQVAAHHHPGMTTLGAKLADGTQPVGGQAKSCEDCHVGDVAALASRLLDRPFAHGPHLPVAPSSEDCLACHSSSAVSRRSEDLAKFDAHADGRSVPADAAKFAKGCLVCHVGADARSLGLVGREPDARKVPQFDHAGHVRAVALTEGEKGIACTQCHVAGGALGFTTPKDVLDCTKCHAHEGDEAKVKRTGPKSTAGDAAKCAYCHDVVRGSANGRVESPPRETITRTHLELAPGVQRHDKSGDCAACHVREGAAAAPYVERIAKAKVKLSIHEDPALANEPFNDPKGDCTQCHRTEPRTYLRRLSRQ